MELHGVKNSGSRFLGARRITRLALLKPVGANKLNVTKDSNGDNCLDIAVFNRYLLYGSACQDAVELSSIEKYPPTADSLAPDLPA
jgi:hypothetical protein